MTKSCLVENREYRTNCFYLWPPPPHLLPEPVEKPDECPQPRELLPQFDKPELIAELLSTTTTA